MHRPTANLLKFSCFNISHWNFYDTNLLYKLLYRQYSNDVNSNIALKNYNLKTEGRA